MTAIQPWEVWLTDFSPQVGSEQAGVRPAIVVGSPDMCRIPRLALVVPCTTRNRRLPFQPELILDQPSVAMCEHVKSVSRDRLIRKLPHVVLDGTREQIRWVLRRLLA